MTHRMMGGCLGAAWTARTGPHTRVPPPAVLRTFKHSPGGVAGTRPPPLGRCPGPGVVLRPTTEKEDDTT